MSKLGAAIKILTHHAVKATSAAGPTAAASLGVSGESLSNLIAPIRAAAIAYVDETDASHSDSYQYLVTLATAARALSSDINDEMAAALTASSTGESVASSTETSFSSAPESSLALSTLDEEGTMDLLSLAQFDEDFSRFEYQVKHERLSQLWIKFMNWCTSEEEMDQKLRWVKK